MKKIFSLAVIVFSIASCGVINNPFDYQQQCWPTYYSTGSCGTCIKDRCDKYCQKCSFHEPACDLCLKCLSHEVCPTRACYKTNYCQIDK